jgi:hypothetical protein
MVMLELFAVLKELGIYHIFDCSDLIDLYQMMMIHPNAILCQGCRKFNWLYHTSDEVEAEYMMCMTPTCKHAAVKRDVPIHANLALPLHGFNLEHFFSFAPPPVHPDKKFEFGLIS